MKITNRLLLIAALFVLVLPLMFTGTASAKYMGDGAVPNGTGGWVTPNDMMCIVGVHADGTVDVADGVTSARDCIYLQTGTMNGGTPFDLTGMTTSAACTTAGGTGNDGAKHSWATTFCTKSLTGLDRTSQMCTAIGGTWITTGKCVAYGRQFKGQDAAGAPLAIGTKGTDASTAGFCYAKMDWTAVYPTASCPSLGATVTPYNSNAAYDWAVASSQCQYAKSIAGKLASALTKADGTTVAAGTYIDLSTITNMGDCLATGGSWNNWAGTAATTTAVGSDSNTYKRPNWDYTRQAPDADNGCLHCHSTKTEYNGPAERFKDSYLKTGHKNMLRKVTAGVKWAGPDGITYDTTGYAAGSIDFSAATATVSGVAKPLLYVFGDWMAVAPAGLDVVVSMSGAAKYNGGSDYSCAACHTAGWSDTRATAGLCTQSSLTTAAACIGTNPITGLPNVWTPLTGVQGIGTPGYAGTKNTDDFPGITFGGAGQWDLEGITCSRCHNAAVGPVTRTQISGGACAYTSAQCTTAGGTFSNGACSVSMDYYTTQTACTTAGATWTAGLNSASIFPVTAPTSGGMGALAPGVGRNGLCFGCHQSMAKTNNGLGADADTANPTNLIVKNTATAPAYAPGFSGHVLGNSFLNSPHARFTGSVVPNSLGKYDLATNSAANYNSTFRGYTCWQSNSSNSPAKTKADGTEIQDKATCEGLYGAGAWRADTNTPADGANSIQGTCTTCHDVHNSLFVTGQEGLRKECDNCHANSTYAADMNTATGSTPFQATAINHPTGTGTPAAEDPASPCVVCHMPKPTSGDFPMHVWRINSNASYSTFPTYAQFNGICSNPAHTTSATCVSPEVWTAPTNKNANAVADSKGYAQAVWVDIDLACGQCHNGANPDAPILPKAGLAIVAAGMHNADGGGMSAAANADCLQCHSSAVGAAAAIIPGTNHHGAHASCVGCHTGHPHDGVTTANNLGKVFATDGNDFCLTCHGNTGVPVTGHAHHHVVPALKAAGKNCSDCHNLGGVAPAPATSTDCLQCHSTNTWTRTAATGGTFIDVITPGTNHHAGGGTGCVYCHNEGPATLDIEARHTGGTGNVYQGITKVFTTDGNDFCLTCHGNTGGYAHHHVTLALKPAGKNCFDCHSFGGVAPVAPNPATNADCMQCHNVGWEKYNGGTDTNTSVMAITPDAGPNDNHHGQNFGGTAHAPCATCHQEGGSYLHMTFANSGGNDALCLSCHANFPTPGALVQGVNHHTGACLSCHNPALPKASDVPTTGITGPGVLSASFGVTVNCAVCHPAEATTIKYAQMSTLNCTDCHTNPGVPPVTSGAGSVCNTCHAGGVYNAYATNMHLQNPVANFAVTASGLTANVDGSASSCPSGKTCSYDFDFGDGAHVAAQTGSHLYASGGSKTIVLTVGVSGSVATDTMSKTVTLVQPNSAPVAHFAAGTPSASGWTITVTDASTDVDGNLTGSSAITVTWGDGATSHTAQNGTVTHTYTSANTYTITLKATDAPGLSNSVTAPVTISLGTVTGTVQAAVGGAPVNLAKVTITVAGVTKTAYTNASGVYTIANVKPGTGYPMSATKGAVTYYNVPGGPSTTVTVNSGPNTVNFTP